jgi:DNA adenine methylase
MKASPIVKWAGGKTRLLPRLLARVPARFGRYYEPFAGGAALFFALEPSVATIADVNPALVTLYQTVVSDLDGLVEVALAHRARHADERYYYDVRRRWNDAAARSAMSPAETSGTFVYLNKTCFNGLWRENKRGGFNVPRGDYVDPAVVDEEALRAARDALARARILRGPFQDTTTDATDGDFAYFDPPYDPLSETSSFTAYAASSFGKAEQRALADHARALDARGVFVMLSNNDTPFVRDLYDGFLIETAPCGRSINSKGDGRGKIDEVIITSRRA